MKNSHRWTSVIFAIFCLLTIGAIATPTIAQNTQDLPTERPLKHGLGFAAGWWSGNGLSYQHYFRNGDAARVTGVLWRSVSDNWYSREMPGTVQAGDTISENTYYEWDSGEDSDYYSIDFYYNLGLQYLKQLHKSQIGDGPDYIKLYLSFGGMLYQNITTYNWEEVPVYIRSTDIDSTVNYYRSTAQIDGDHRDSEFGFNIGTGVGLELLVFEHLTGNLEFGFTFRHQPDRPWEIRFLPNVALYYSF